MKRALLLALLVVAGCAQPQSAVTQPPAMLPDGVQVFYVKRPAVDRYVQCVGSYRSGVTCNWGTSYSKDDLP